jgi:hypothetical protein
MDKFCRILFSSKGWVLGEYLKIAKRSEKEDVQIHPIKSGRLNIDAHSDARLGRNT